MGKLDVVIFCYEKVIEINLNFFWSYYSLGNVYIK